jgi:hypothetical protein
VYNPCVMVHQTASLPSAGLAVAVVVAVSASVDL